MRIDRSNNKMISQWWWTIDRGIIGAVMALIFIGMILIMAASPSVAEHINKDNNHFIIRQAVFMVVGVTLMVLISMLPVIVIRRAAVIGFLGCILLLVLVLLFGSEIKGAKRWISLPGFSLQPSEFIKPLFAVVTAWVLARKQMVDSYPGFKIAIGLYLIIATLLIMQPDFGMTIAVTSIWGIQMFLAGLSLWLVVSLSVIGIGAIVAAYIFLPHVAKRINTFIDPKTGDNYQVDRAHDAFANGGFFGMGPGQGVVKETVPDAHTDFIFSVAGEELGTLFCLSIVFLYFFIIVRVFLKVYKENNLFLILAVSGLLVQISIQALVNMGVALALIPNTGMTLPLISYGGSSTIAISMSFGMILAFTRKRYGVIMDNSKKYKNN